MAQPRLCGKYAFALFADLEEDEVDEALAARMHAVVSMSAAEGTGQAQSRRSRRRRSRSRSASPIQTLLRGKEPNLNWRATTLEELRADPRFVALPPVEAVHVGGPATFRWVRQDDPLWDALHAGVLTSRSLLGVLGMCEAESAALLGLHPAMASRGAALSAWASLQRPTTWDPGASAPEEDVVYCQLNAKLTAAHNGDAALPARGPRSRKSQARGRARRLGAGCSIGTVRCAWGSAQEASTLRSLVEHATASPGLVVEEAGLEMLDPARLPPRMRDAASGLALPPIGASPDAFLRLPDGSREPVEVKNVCPFVVDRKRPGAFCVWAGPVDGSPGSSLARGPDLAVRTTHVPQVQLELLSSGCAAARLVSSSACCGANVFRMPLDEEYAALLLRFVHLFYARYVVPGVEPPADFFLQAESAEERAAYRRLLARTAAIARETAVADHIAEPWRAREGDRFFL